MAEEVTTPEEQEGEAAEAPQTLTVQDFAARLAAKRGLANDQADLEEEAAALEAPEATEEEASETTDVETTPTPEEAAAAEQAADEAEAALPDDATDEEREQARADAEAEFYVGRYKTREEAERGLAEKDAMIGRLGQQAGEAQRQLEALQAEREQVEEVQEELDTPQWREWAENAVSEGQGANGAIAALKEGGYAGYEIYLRAWLSDPEQIADALLFNNELTREMAEQRAAIAAAPTAEQQEETREREVEKAKQAVLARRPDLPDYEEAMGEVLDSLPPERREWLRAQAEEGVEGKQLALEWLYLEARVHRSGLTETAAAAERKQRTASADRAKLAATSSSAEATPARTPLSEAEQRGAEKRDSLREAWGLEPRKE